MTPTEHLKHQVTALQAAHDEAHRLFLQSEQDYQATRQLLIKAGGFLHAYSLLNEVPHADQVKAKELLMLIWQGHVKDAVLAAPPVAGKRAKAR